MPRRKRGFIDRSRARTYELVHRPQGDERDGPARVLRRSARDGGGGGDDDEHAYDSGRVEGDRDMEEQYLRGREVLYGLGEYGLADDGYDYAKHFKKVGGEGGVFVGKGGWTNADGVMGGRVRDGGRVEMRDVEGEVEDVEGEDEERKRRAEEELRRAREGDEDVDEVLAALEASDDEEWEEEGEGGEGEEGKDGESDELEDDFLVRAKGSEEDGVQVKVGRKRGVGGRGRDGEVRQAGEGRKNRLLDQRFDELMLSYGGGGGGGGDEQGDDDEDGRRCGSGEEEDGDDDDSDDVGWCELDDSMVAALSADLPSGVARVDNDIDVAMDALVGQYRRATVAETYDGPDALRAPEAVLGVRKAAAKHFDGDGGACPAPVPKTDRHGNDICGGGDDVGSSGGGEEEDEEYAPVWETVVERRTGNKWDCETILSTYSNLDNHPSVIGDGAGSRVAGGGWKRRKEAIIRLDPRTSLPVEFGQVEGGDDELGVDEVGGGDGDDERYYVERTHTGGSHVGVRNKEESKEEKRNRKAAAKAGARERRAEKSATKKAFAEEFKKQGKHEATIGTSKVAVRF